MFSWADGSVLAQFGSLSSGPGELGCPLGLRLLCGGNELVVADSNYNQLSVFTITGDFVSSLGSSHRSLVTPQDVVEYGTDGGFLTANFSTIHFAHVSRAGAVTDVFDSTVTSAIQLDNPRALAALPEGGLVVRTREQLHVFNGLNARLAWITACVMLARPIPDMHP